MTDASTHVVRGEHRALLLVVERDSAEAMGLPQLQPRRPCPRLEQASRGFAGRVRFPAGVICFFIFLTPCPPRRDLTLRASVTVERGRSHLKVTVRRARAVAPVKAVARQATK